MKITRFFMMFFWCLFIGFTSQINGKVVYQKPAEKNKQNKKTSPKTSSANPAKNNNHNTEHIRTVCYETLKKLNALSSLQHLHSKYSKTDFLDTQKLILEYQFLCKNYSSLSTKKSDQEKAADKLDFVENIIQCYQESQLIDQIDQRIAQAFNIIKKHLGIDPLVEMRVYPNYNYKLLGSKKCVGFFHQHTPGIVYIAKSLLQDHPIFIIATIVHELEHHRQFFLYPDSFEWTVKNQQLLGKDEFNRQLEHGADKRVAKYFKCHETLRRLAQSCNYVSSDPQGYFATNDYQPYIFKNRFFCCTGFKDLNNPSDNILDYLPNTVSEKVTSNAQKYGNYDKATSVLASYLNTV